MNDFEVGCLVTSKEKSPGFMPLPPGLVRPMPMSSPSSKTVTNMSTAPSLPVVAKSVRPAFGFFTS